MKPYIKIALHTKVETSPWHVGDAFIDLFTKNKLLFPDFVSHNPDKFSEKFPGKDSCKDIWASVAQIRAKGSMSEFHQDFCLRRNRAIRYRSSLSHRMINIRSKIVPASFDLQAEWSEKIDWLSLFNSLCGIFPPQLAMLHLFTESELNSIGENSNFAIGSFGAALNPYIPGVGWAMFYGDDFSGKINVQSIRSSGFRVEQMGSGYMIIATAKINDVSDNYSSFCARRNDLRKLFPAGLFMQSK